MSPPVLSVPAAHAAAPTALDAWLRRRVLRSLAPLRHGGLGWVNKRKARSPQPGVCLGVTCRINPGIHPANQRENQHYPEVILRRYEPLYASTMGWGKGACQ